MRLIMSWDFYRVILHPSQTVCFTDENMIFNLASREVIKFVTLNKVLGHSVMKYM